MAKTNIEWAQAVWNPVTGCDKVSPGCKNCYAEKMANRLQRMGQANYANGFKLTLHPHMLEIPLKRKTPTIYFANSMSDLFHKDVPDEYIDKVFAIMALCPQHTFQILTKRADRMRDYFKTFVGSAAEQRGYELGAWLDSIIGIDNVDVSAIAQISKGLPNCWLGVSVENQKAADERIPLLLETPAAVRWLSCEPLLGKVNLTLQSDELNTTYNALTGEFSGNSEKGNKIDWIVVGGESGHGARACSIHWIRRIVKHCKSAKVPVFVKQLGSKPIWGTLNEPVIELKIKSKKGGDISEFPEDLQVREFPNK